MNTNILLKLSKRHMNIEAVHAHLPHKTHFKLRFMPHAYALYVAEVNKLNFEI